MGFNTGLVSFRKRERAEVINKVIMKPFCVTRFEPLSEVNSV